MGQCTSANSDFLECAKSGDLATFKSCIESGVDVNIQDNVQHFYFLTAYFKLVYISFVFIIQVGSTALHKASLCGHIELVKCIVETGNFRINSQDNVKDDSLFHF